MKTVPCVLTIAGSDSGGGAGLQADARTIQACGAFALTAVSAVTAQHTRGIERWMPVPAAILRAQVEAVLGDFDVRAIKTGLLPAEALPVVANLAAGRPAVPLVVDPVLGSSSGTRFLKDREIARLKRGLLRRAALVTPNWPEAAKLSGRKVRTFDEAEAAAVLLAGEMGCAVLVKGGHAPGRICSDCLVLPDGRIRWYSSPRIVTRNTHGTGCVLSAAIATRLARGDDVESAVHAARGFLSRQLRAGRSIRIGKGKGPAFPGVG